MKKRPSLKRNVMNKNMNKVVNKIYQVNINNKKKSNNKLLKEVNLISLNKKIFLKF